MLVYVSRVINSDGSEDLEILSGMPTTEFIWGLENAISDGRIQGFVIREGYVNGGDSREIHNSMK